MLRMRTHTLRHARTARVIGQRLPGTDAVVVDTADRLAYCVAGRPKTIVITTGALDALVPDQLGAVLAHERAHLIGRHHLLLASVRGLAAAAPWMRLFRDGATEIALLLEMCADDSAARSMVGGRYSVVCSPSLVRPSLPRVPSARAEATCSLVLIASPSLCPPPCTRGPAPNCP